MQRLLNLNNILTVLIFSNLFFTSYVLLKNPFEMYPGYLIIMLILPFWALRYQFNAYILVISIILLAGGMYGISVNGNTSDAFVKIYVNVVINLMFYYYLFKAFDEDVRKLFSFYIIGAKIVIIIGLIQLISFNIGFTPGYDYSSVLNKWGFTETEGLGIKVNSILSEPSYWGATLAPIFFVALYTLFGRDSSFLSLRWAIFVVVMYPLSFSSVGYIGIFIGFSLILINLGGIKLGAVVVPLILVGHFYLLQNEPEYRRRFEGSTKLAEGQASSAYEVHGSSFVLFNHTHVMQENFRRNPILGTGLGSHQFAYDKYSLVKSYGGIYDFNRQDANSMALRTLSETGIIGAGILLFFILKFFLFKIRNPYSNLWVISNACFAIILLQLLRQGNYTYNGFFFYLMLYYFVWKREQQIRREQSVQDELELDQEELADA